jgi:CPA1 family monovalent cation:H+ antiporter
VAVIRHYAQHTLLPAESWLLVAGIGYGLLEPRASALPTLVLNPEIVVSILLPVLMFAECRRLPFALLLSLSGPLSLLGLIGAPLTMALIGLPVAWLLDIPYMHGLLFGAAVAATDPLPVSRIFSQFHISERIRYFLQGESIFNDAIAVVAFFSLSAAVFKGAEMTAAGIAIQAMRSVLVAVPVGLILGWLAALLVRQWREQNRVPGLTLTLILPFSSFLLSDRLLNASGIIAVLCAAIAFSYSRQDPHSKEHELYDDLWHFLGNMATSVLYFALGAAIAAKTGMLEWRLAFGVILLLLASRVVLIHGAGPLLRMQGRSLPRDWRNVIVLGGLRGAVPAALVLMTPQDYAYRDQLLTMVFVLVTYTVIVHPPILQQYLKHHAVNELPGVAKAEPNDPGLSALPPSISRRLQASSWGLAAIAGVIAGIVFLALEMTLVSLLQNNSPWAPVRMIAAIGMSSAALPPPAGFAVDVALVAFIIHFTLSLVYAWALTPLIEHRRLISGTLLGALFGLVLYLVNFYLFTALFPWFAEARTSVTIVAHLIFGAVLASSYLLMRKHI